MMLQDALPKSQQHERQGHKSSWASVAKVPDARWSKYWAQLTQLSDPTQVMLEEMKRRQEVNNTQHAKTTLRPSWQIGRILFVK